MTTIREATTRDGPALVRLLLDEPIGASADFVLDRGPDFFALLALRGTSRTFVAERGDVVVGCVTTVWHDVSTANGTGAREWRVGEVADLRLARPERGGPVVARLLEAAACALQLAGTHWVTCLVGDGNRAAEVLLEGRCGFPAFSPLAQYRSVHFPVWRWPARTETNRVSARRADDSTGFDRAWIATDGDGRPAGELSLWDGSPVRRIRVTRYPASAQPLRVLMAGLGAVGAGTALPRPGDPLRTWASRRFTARDASHDIARVLLAAAMRDALREGQHVLQINLEARDPLLRALPAIPRSVYGSTGYGAALQPGVPSESFAALTHMEVALA